MNAKKAKALRKLVRNLQKQQGEIPAHGFVTVRNTDKHIMVNVPANPTPEQAEQMGKGMFAATVPIGDDKEAPQRVEKVTIFEGQKRVAPRSQRAVYLHLKSELEKIGRK